jgi:hypothetical protein
VCSQLSGQQQGGHPLQARYENGAAFRWLNKPVLESRLLDGMETRDNWLFTGHGKLTLSDSQVKQGMHSLRLHSATDEATTGGEGEWIDLMATRKFAGEDWSAYNRLSLWVFPDVEGAPAISCSLILHNDGSHKLPDRYNEGRNESIPLNNHQWNQVVWEIAPLDRNRVTALDFAYSLPKKYPDAGDHTTIYIDQLELQKVDPDHVEGWDVAAGKIAFSGGGYPSGAPKSAIASGLSAREFSVLRENSGELMLTRPVQTVSTPLGTYQLLDFSAIREPGRYFIRAGETQTRSFEIGVDPWRASIEKAINFLYSERCGTVIPGLHGICHQDCYTDHAGRRIIVNGGYHDAGDLTATGNTPGVSYSLFALAERLREQGFDPLLEKRVIEEAKWGLNWVLKTRFGDGYRSTGQLISYWTNGVMGDGDDRHGEAVNDPEWNFRVSSTEAIAYKVLKESDPELANRSLAIAKEDWQFAVKGLETAQPLPVVYGQKDELERISIGALASVDLFEATGAEEYADKAFTLAALVMKSQERKLQPWTIPLGGYFYSGPRRESLFQRFHMGEEQAPIVALARLCTAFPNHPDWMQWYSALVLHSKYYLERAARVNEPYGVLPAAVYRESDARFISGKKEWTPLRAADSDAFAAEVRAGVPLGKEFYLRRFPVWFDFRGNFSVLLSQAKALSTAAQTRGSLEGIDLAAQQAEWILGRNPFAASMMYGEGYDWTPLYSVRSGQMVGALPVGIETKGFSDAPYWPNQIGWTYKEVWTHSVGRWIWLMEDLTAPAMVSGEGTAGSRGVVEFREEQSGAVTPVQMDPAGFFRTSLAEGRYVVNYGLTTLKLTALPGRTYHIDLRPDHSLSFEASAEQRGSSDITISLTVRGSGTHQFEIRTNNLTMPEKSKKLDLGGAAKIEWHGQIQDRETPWVAVVVPDGVLNDKQELTGTAQ